MTATDAADFFGKTQPARILWLGRTSNTWPCGYDTCLRWRHRQLHRRPGASCRINQVMKRVVAPMRRPVMTQARTSARRSSTFSFRPVGTGLPARSMRLSMARPRFRFSRRARTRTDFPAAHPAAGMALSSDRGYWAKDRLNDESPIGSTHPTRARQPSSPAATECPRFRCRGIQHPDARAWCGLTNEQGKEASSAPVTLPALSQPTRKGNDRRSGPHSAHPLARGHGRAASDPCRTEAWSDLRARQQPSTTGDASRLSLRKCVSPTRSRPIGLHIRNQKGLPAAGWSFEEIAAPGSWMLRCVGTRRPIRTL